LTRLSTFHSVHLAPCQDNCRTCNGRAGCKWCKAWGARSKPGTTADLNPLPCLLAGLFPDTCKSFNFEKCDTGDTWVDSCDHEYAESPPPPPLPPSPPPPPPPPPKKCTACEEWYDDDVQAGSEWLTNLPPCPCTRQAIEEDEEWFALTPLLTRRPSAQLVCILAQVCGSSRPVSLPPGRVQMLSIPPRERQL